jgi:hypothetical protein
MSTSCQLAGFAVPQGCALLMMLMTTRSHLQQCHLLRPTEHTWLEASHYLQAGTAAAQP